MRLGTGETAPARSPFTASPHKRVCLTPQVFLGFLRVFYFDGRFMCAPRERFACDRLRFCVEELLHEEVLEELQFRWSWKKNSMKKPHVISRGHASYFVPSRSLSWCMGRNTKRSISLSMLYSLRNPNIHEPRSSQ